MVNFSLMQHHKYSLTEIENMMPWEKEIYVGLLLQHLEQEKLRIQQEANDRKAAGRNRTSIKRLNRR